MTADDKPPRESEYIKNDMSQKPENNDTSKQCVAENDNPQAPRIAWVYTDIFYKPEWRTVDKDGKFDFIMVIEHSAFEELQRKLGDIQDVAVRWQNAAMDLQARLDEAAEWNGKCRDKKNELARTNAKLKTVVDTVRNYLERNRGFNNIADELFNELCQALASANEMQNSHDQNAIECMSLQDVETTIQSSKTQGK